MAAPKRGSVVDSYRTVSVECSKCSTKLFRYKKKNGTNSNLVKCYVERICEDSARLLENAPEPTEEGHPWHCPQCSSQFARSATMHGRPALKMGAVKEEDYEAAANLKKKLEQMNAEDPVHQISMMLEQAISDEDYASQAISDGDLYAPHVSSPRPILVQSLLSRIPLYDALLRLFAPSVQLPPSRISSAPSEHPNVESQSDSFVLECSATEVPLHTSATPTYGIIPLSRSQLFFVSECSLQKSHYKRHYIANQGPDNISQKQLWLDSGVEWVIAVPQCDTSTMFFNLRAL
eukprot:gene11213-18835_t